MKIPQFQFNKHMKQIEHIVTENSPAILTGIGVVGVVGTALLTWKATKAAEAQLADAAFVRNSHRTATDEYDKDPFTKAEKFSMTWKLYVAPVLSATLTIGCVIGAQKINTARAAALAGLLATQQEDIKKYRDKVTEQLTGPKNQKIKDELAADKVHEMERQNPGMFADTPAGKVWIVDGASQQAILTTKELVRKAENDVNQLIDGQESATVSDFYERAGFRSGTLSDKYGWNTANRLMLEWTTVEVKDGQPALEFEFVIDPVRHPWSKQSFRPQRDEATGDDD